MKPRRFRGTLLLLIIAGTAGLFAAGWSRVAIDTDVIRSLPVGDPVIRDAARIFLHHPMQDQLTLDVEIDRDDKDLLVECGRMVAAELEKSGLFKSVGMEDIQARLPHLVKRVLENLPFLFSEKDLAENVSPLLVPGEVDRAIGGWEAKLLEMSGIGQAAYIAHDPLGLKDLLLARLLNLAPSRTAEIYRGRLISGDGRHLLVTAALGASGTDTAFARRLTGVLAEIDRRIRKHFEAGGVRVTLTPVGAYRAALDNETIIRADVRNAILFATLGIAVLLLLSFPRPLIGLFSLLPALAGTATAFFVWSLIHPSISVMVLGFGGAVISISVDHGIAYLLFLDRPSESFGKDASREIRSVGLLATLTTVGAFCALMLSDFPMFRELGLFTAMGIGFSFLFVHTVFPRVFPSLPAAKDRRLPLPRLADRLSSFGSRGALAALVLFAIMLFFSRPGFNLDLSVMNTVTEESRAAENRLLGVWGNIFGKVFLMVEAGTLEDLQRKEDRLLARLEADPNREIVDQAFLPAMLFPGPERRAANLAAWKAFWSGERVSALTEAMGAAGVRHGFTADAFTPFYDLLTDPAKKIGPADIPPAFFNMIGIVPDTGHSEWRLFFNLTLPEGYGGDSFYSRYGTLAKIFDPALFSDRLGRLMFTTFAKLLLIVAALVAGLLLFFFLDVRLTLYALAPILFALVCTLGTLSLLGRRLDIPSLMLATIVLGMGIDYSLFFVRSYQRYGDAAHPSFSMIRSAVVMASASTLIGFGVLATARHSLLKSAGVTSLLGIGFSAIGAFLILPPLLDRYFRNRRPNPGSRDPISRTLDRYRGMEPYPRLFARFKARLDPMFGELPGLIDLPAPPRKLLDIGTGFGVPACWLAETFPTARVYAIEPVPERARVAARALAERGAVVCGGAPDLPPSAPSESDAAFMLDMIHFLSDAQLALTLERLHAALVPGGRLLIRAVMVPNRRIAWCWWLEKVKLKFAGLPTFYRSAERMEAMLRESRFSLESVSPSGRNGDMLWLKSAKRGI